MSRSARATTCFRWTGTSASAGRKTCRSKASRPPSARGQRSTTAASAPVSAMPRRGRPATAKQPPATRTARTRDRHVLSRSPPSPRAPRRWLIVPQRDDPEFFVPSGTELDADKDHQQPSQTVAFPLDIVGSSVFFPRVTGARLLFIASTKQVCDSCRMKATTSPRDREIRALNTALWRMSEQYRRGFSRVIDPGRYGVLNSVAAHEVIRPTEVADELDMVPSSVSRHLQHWPPTGWSRWRATPVIGGRRWSPSPTRGVRRWSASRRPGSPPPAR